MSDGDRGPAAAPDGDAQQTVAEIRQMLKEIQATQRAMRARSLVMTVLIVALILGFASATYFKLKSNLSQEKLATAAAVRMPQLLPQLQEPISQTLRGVVPFYVDMGRQRFAAVGPKLDARAREEADALERNLEKKLNAQLEQFFAHVTAHATVELAKNFPAVSGAGADKVGAKIQQVILQEDQKLRKQAQDLYTAESKRIGDALAKFPVPDVRQTDLETLNRQLLHNLLMFADYEMVLKDSPTLVAQKASH